MIEDRAARILRLVSHLAERPRWPVWLHNWSFNAYEDRMAVLNPMLTSMPPVGPDGCRCGLGPTVHATGCPAYKRVDASTSKEQTP